MTYRVIHPIATGPLVSLLRDGLLASTESYAANVTVQRDLPETKTARMVTVRDDGGPDETVFSIRRQGINVWADDPVDAEHLALLSAAILRSTSTDVIVAVDSITSPIRIDDDPAYIVGGKPLAHFYFACRARIRGSNF